MKLLELVVEDLAGIGSGVYRFTDRDSRPRDAIVFRGDGYSALLETIAALLEATRAAGPTAHGLAWWARRRGPSQARLRIRWELSEGEAARVGAPRRRLTSEWRFGPGDELPREVRVDGVDGVLSRHTRADLAAYCHLDANRGAIWMGSPDDDPLVEMLAAIARHDVLTTRVYYRRGVGIVGWHTPDTFAVLSRAIAVVFPELRIERVSCAPVACFRGEERVQLDQLADAERDAIYIVGQLHEACVREGVILVDRPELHAPREARGRWLEWLAGLAGTNQLIMATGSADVNGSPA